MTFDELEQSVRELRENQIVQGEMLHRTEAKMEHFDEGLDRLEGVVERLAKGMVELQSAMKGMVQSVDGLSATVDRFIRGMEGDGHGRKRS